MEAAAGEIGWCPAAAAAAAAAKTVFMRTWGDGPGARRPRSLLLLL